MASRVNIRFVTILAGAMAALFVGMAATAWFVLRKSAEDQAVIGDAAMEAGDYKTAHERYGRAISKDNANVEYYVKFRDAIAAWNPEEDTVYREAFFKSLSAMRQIATLRQTDVDAHDAYLDAQYRIAQLGADRIRWEELISETEVALVNFEYATEMDAETERRWPALRRYRGFACKELIAAGHTITSEQAEVGLADLQAALEVNPWDVQAAINLAHWHAVLADRAIAAGRPEQADAAYALAEGALAAALEVSPDDPELRIAEIQVAEQVRSTRIDRLASPEARFAQQRQIAESLEPRFDALLELLLTELPPNAITHQTLMKLRIIERYFRAEMRNEATLRVLDRARQHRPEDATLHYIEGVIASDLGERERAIEAFEHVAEAQRPPVSLEGVLLSDLKVQAMVRQTRDAVAMAEEAGGGAIAGAALQRARGFRDRLASAMPAEAPVLKLVDAEIAFAGGAVNEAQRLLTEFARETGGNEESLRLHAQVLTRMNQPGAARDKLSELTELNARNWLAFYLLGQVEEALQNWTEAEKAYARAWELAPWNEEIGERLGILRVVSGQTRSDDPIQQAIAEAAQLARAVNNLRPEPERAEQVLLNAIKQHGEDPRLVRALVNHYITNGRREEAARIAAEAAARNPDDETLAGVAERARIVALTPEERLDMIESSDASEEDKLSSAYSVLLAAGRTEEAEAVIDELARIAPDSPLAIDGLFIRALRADDFAAAERLAARAAEVNADQAAGLTFRGRLLLEKGQIEEAAQALGEAVARGVAGVEVRRVLASAQLALGRTPQALETLRQALGARPNDVPTIMQTLQVLIRMRQYDEALRLARESEAFAGADDGFVHMWLDLEAQSGSKELAMRRRQEILASRPDDRNNQFSLARLYVEIRDRRATDLIAHIRAEGDALPAVDLDARWRFAQGDVAGARQVYTDAIAQRDAEGGGEAAMQARLGFAAFLSSIGDAGGAVDVLEAARDVQQASEADYALARLYTNLGAFGKAAEAYRRILDSGAEDAEGMLRISLAEAHILAGDGQRGLELLDALPERLQEDPAAAVLRADALRATGRAQEADRALNEAIAMDPDFPRGFLKRAQVSLEKHRAAGEDGSLSETAGRGMLEDAIADLNKALELDPALWPALQLRAEAHLRAGRIDDAVADVERAISINQSLSDLRIGLLDILLREERFDEVGRIVDSTLRTRPEDLTLLQTMGDRLAGAGREREAMKVFDAAWEVSRIAPIAGRIVELSLRSDRPDLRRAREVLAEPGLGIDGSPQLLMLRALLESKAGRPQQMREDALTSLALVLDKPGALNLWLQQSERLFQNRAEWLSFVSAAGLERAPGGWGYALLGGALARSPDTVEDGIDLLERVAQTSTDEAAIAAASRDLGSAYFTLGRHEDAVAAWRRSLEIQPSAEVANNLAFTLADALGRAEEALPFALAAAEQSPRDPSILDTLGVVQTRVGHLEEAAETLRSALELTGEPAPASLLLHLADLEARRGNKEAASDYLTRAGAALGAEPSESYRDVMDRIRREIDAL